MKQKLELEQKQILRLSQEMKLSFEVLSMSNDELLKYWMGKVEGSHQTTEDSFFENLREEEDFYQYLENQLLYMEIPAHIQKQLIFCIHNLSPAGFLEMSDLELCSHLNIPQKGLGELYHYLYQLQPTGVGTRNFKEAIHLQLQKKKKWEPKMWEILNHLEYIAAGREKELAKRLELEEKELENMLIEIKSCNPKPSRGFMVKKSVGISPDFILKIQNGKLLLVEDENLQKNLYKIDMKENQGLQLLRQCIERRIETLRKILEYLVEHQRDYFLEQSSLRTLHAKEVAEHLDLHTSTISRAIRNKYLKTEKGVYSLKSLFCFSEERNQVKQEIQNLIEGEKKEKPYSDAEISQYLEKAFLWRVSRRTIGKYREELGYGSSFERKWR